MHMYILIYKIIFGLFLYYYDYDYGDYSPLPALRLNKILIKNLSKTKIFESLQPDDVNIWSFKLRLLDLTKFIIVDCKVYDIGLQI